MRKIKRFAASKFRIFAIFWWLLLGGFLLVGTVDFQLKGIEALRSLSNDTKEWESYAELRTKVADVQVGQSDRTERVEVTVSFEVHNVSRYPYRIPKKWVRLRFDDGRAFNPVGFVGGESSSRIIVPPGKVVRFEAKFRLSQNSQVVHDGTRIELGEPGQGAALFHADGTPAPIQEATEEVPGDTSEEPDTPTA